MGKKLPFFGKRLHISFVAVGEPQNWKKKSSLEISSRLSEANSSLSHAESRKSMTEIRKNMVSRRARQGAEKAKRWDADFHR